MCQHDCISSTLNVAIVKTDADIMHSSMEFVAWTVRSLHKKMQAYCNLIGGLAESLEINLCVHVVLLQL